MSEKRNHFKQQAARNLTKALNDEFAAKLGQNVKYTTALRLLESLNVDFTKSRNAADNGGTLEPDTDHFLQRKDSSRRLGELLIGDHLHSSKNKVYWDTTKNSILTISGGAGSGKSILALSLIEDFFNQTLGMGDIVVFGSHTEINEYKDYLFDYIEAGEYIRHAVNFNETSALLEAISFVEQKLSETNISDEKTLVIIDSMYEIERMYYENEEEQNRQEEFKKMLRSLVESDNKNISLVLVSQWDDSFESTIPIRVPHATVKMDRNEIGTGAFNSSSYHNSYKNSTFNFHAKFPSKKPYIGKGFTSIKSRPFEKIRAVRSK